MDFFFHQYLLSYFYREKAQIHPLLDSDDLIGGELDKKCVFTYLLTLYHGLKTRDSNKHSVN